MAIIIPSKNIYSIDNPKIRDNFLGNVIAEGAKVTPTVDIRTSAYNQNTDEFSSGSALFKWDIQKVDTTGTTATIVTYNEAISYVTLESFYANIYIVIPKVGKNSLIQKIYTGVDNNNNENISATIYYVKQEQPIQANLYVANAQNYPTPTSPLDNIQYGEITETDGINDIPEPKIENPVSAGGVTANATLEMVDETNIATAEATSDDDNYYLSLKVLSGLDIKKLSHSYEYTGIVGGATPPNPKILSGARTYYKPTSVEITIYGDVYSLKMEDVSIPHGEGGKPFTMSGNELLQTTNTIYNESAIKYFADKILKEYKNGKETATIKCDINDYYNEQGQKVISADGNVGKMSFRIHDEVIPHVFGADRKDKPMSTYSDGTPKIFRVVGIRTFYDGAVWQELSLQEVTK